MKFLALHIASSALVLVGCGTMTAVQVAELRATRELVDRCASEGRIYLNVSFDLERRYSFWRGHSDYVRVSGHCIMPADREQLEAEAAQMTGATKTEAENRMVITSADRSTQYYFTEPGHAAYPWAVKVFLLPDIPGAPQTPATDRWRWLAAKPKNSPVPSTVKESDMLIRWMISALNAARMTG